MYILWAWFALMQFAIGRVWRYLLIVDVYLSDDFKEITFVNLKNEQRQFNVDQVAKRKSRAGITDVTINDNNEIVKFYFMPNSKDNLKYFPS
ncbi:MAG TPA: hypothetical protein VHE59_01010 [Mucilaginibacter sp.]|nr:hypothetical protein [Mucilaginibacter sp.]